MKEADVDKLFNQEAAGVITWVRAEVSVHQPFRLLEGETADGSCLEEDAEAEGNKLTEETPVESGPVLVLLQCRAHVSLTKKEGIR